MSWRSKCRKPPTCSAIVTRKVPVQVARLVDEEVVRKVPVQVCRMVQEEQVRRVPVTTYRQVVERVQQQTPVQVCKMVEEEVVRRIPVTTCRMVTEERVEQIPVQVCKMVAVRANVPRAARRRKAGAGDLHAASAADGRDAGADRSLRCSRPVLRRDGSRCGATAVMVPAPVQPAPSGTASSAESADAGRARVACRRTSWHRTRPSRPPGGQPRRRRSEAQPESQRERSARSTRKPKAPSPTPPRSNCWGHRPPNRKYHRVSDRGTDQAVGALVRFTGGVTRASRGYPIECLHGLLRRRRRRGWTNRRV